MSSVRPAGRSSRCAVLRWPAAVWAGVLGGILTLPAAGAGPVLLDEVLADNRRAVAVAGRFPDYVELRNATADPVDLGGCVLEDDSGALSAWVIPPGTRLEPGARWVVWCDRTPGLPSPQALFGLGASGDRLRLRGPDGSVWDEVAFGLQVGDLAIGRAPGSQGDSGGLGGDWRLVAPSPGAPNVAVSTGDPARLRLNEWMAAPSTGDDWIEVYNGDDRPVGLGGLILTDRMAVPPSNRPVPAGSFIGSRALVQFFASDLRQPGADHLDFRLSAGGETVSLVGADRATLLDRVTWGALGPDESGGKLPDGGGSQVVFGAGRATPGAPNGRPLTRVRISEVLSHTDPPQEDAIELHNPTAAPVDVGHWWLSDAASNPRKFRIPAGTVLEAGGYAVFYQYQFGAGSAGFSLNSYEGDQVWLSVGDAAGRLTGESAEVRFGAARNGVSLGTVETSIGTDFAPLARPTLGVEAPSTLLQFRQGRGARNAGPAIPAGVLAKWFPAAGQGGREPFLEVLNPHPAPLRLFDPLFPAHAWRVRGDLRFDLPPGLVLAPGARLLIVAFNPAADPGRLAAFRAAHDVPESVPVLGPWEGSPGSRGVTIELQSPDAPEGPDKPRPGFVPYLRVDRIDYLPEAGWPAWEPPARTALRRSDPAGHGNEPRSWAVDRPSPGRESPPPEPVDGDADGMPDAWEREHGLNPDDPGDAGDDPDRDGAGNRDEYRAGTDPREGTEVLRLRARAEGNRVRLEFPGVAGRRYELESRAGSGGVPWEKAAGPWNPAASGPVSIEVTAGEAGRWYRVVLREGP